jgi:hypothetical protein
MGASTSRNPKGVHGLYRDNFTFYLITLRGKWQTCISCLSVRIKILRKHFASTQTIIYKAESHLTDYKQTSPAIEWIWVRCSTDVGSRNSLISSISRHASSPTEKSGRRGTNVRRIAAVEGIGFPIVWRILHEQFRYPYQIQQVQFLTPPDHRARIILTNSFTRDML